LHTQITANSELIPLAGALKAQSEDDLKIAK
jgi:hypothetical protein